MRRLFVVLALLTMMLGLDALRGSQSVTLAAIGFVILAAFAIAELGGRMSLPKVTGYIVSGVVLGPYAADVITQAVVGEMNMFGTLALGLIATTAGLELELKGLAKLTKTLAATIGIKIVLCALFVGGAVVAMGMGTNLLGLDSPAQIYGLAMLMAALAIGTSPAIALAVASESNAKGRLTELVLGAAVAKDVVVVIAFNVALATAIAMSTGATLGVGVLIHVAEELGASVIAGVLLGGLLIAYLRFVKTEMLLFVIAMVLVVAEAAVVLKAEFHIILELLLVFIVAGMMVRNLAPKFEHDLLDPLKTVSLPVFIVFFTNAGAKIDLGATWSVLPAALVICGVRALAYFISARAGGRVGKESEPVRKLAWLAYLPQAGVALTLVALALGRLNELSGLEPDVQAGVDQFTSVVASIGIAVVAINLLVGPITLRSALRKAGEIGTPEEAEAPEEAPVEPAEVEAPNLERLESVRLRNLVTETRTAYADAWSPWRENHLEPALREMTRQFAGSDDDESTGSDSDKVLARVERLRPSQFALGVDDIREVLLHQSDFTQSLPLVETVPLEAHLAAVSKADDIVTRIRKRWSGFFSFFTGRGRRKRQLPVQLAVRVAFEPRMVRLAESAQRNWQRHQGRCLETLQKVVLQTTTWSETREELAQLEAALLRQLDEDREAAIDAASRELIEIFCNAGSPGARARVRFSRVEREIEASLARASKDAEAWTRRQKAAITLLDFVAAVERAQGKLRDRLASDVMRPLDDAFSTLEHEVGEELNRLATIVVPEEKDLDDEMWTRVGLQSGAVLTKPAAKQLRTASSRVRRATSTSSPFAALMAFVNDGEDTLEIVPSLSDLIDNPRPATANVVTVDVRELKEVQIAGRLLPSIEQRLESVAEQFSAARDTMREAATLVDFGYQSAEKARADGDGNSLSRLEEALGRARSMLEALPEGPCKAWGAVRDELGDDVADMSRRLVEASRAVASGQRAEVESLPSTRERVASVFSEGVAAARQLTERLTLAAQRGTAGDLAERYRLRARGGRLDAQTVRSLLDEQRKRRKPKIEGLYSSLFTAGPLRDPRLFALHRDALRSVVKAERAWQADTTRGNGALVIGPVGGGKSSTLVIAQLKLSTRRVFTVRRTGVHDETLWSALGRVFDVDPQPAKLAKAMCATRSVVLVDDLHTWFNPNHEGVEDLRRFLAFMAEHSEQAFWLTSIAEESMEVFRAIAPIEQAFGCIVRLRRPSTEQLEEAIAARHDLAGLALDLPSDWRSDLRRRFLRRSERSSYALQITHASGGNLRRALQLWLVHANLDGEAVVLRELSSSGWSVPFLPRLPTAVLAVLATLQRYGPTSVKALVCCTGLSETALTQAVRFALAATLIREVETSGQFRLDPGFADDIASGLAEAGIFAEGAAA